MQGPAGAVPPAAADTSSSSSSAEQSSGPAGSGDEAYAAVARALRDSDEDADTRLHEARSAAACVPVRMLWLEPIAASAHTAHETCAAVKCRCAGMLFSTPHLQYRLEMQSRSMPQRACLECLACSAQLADKEAAASAHLRIARRPRLTIQGAATVLLTAAAAVLAGPAPDQAPGGSANGAAFDWAAAGGNGAASAAHPSPSPNANVNGAHVNGLLNGAVANGHGASEAGLVLPVQVRLLGRCMAPVK